MVTVIILAGGVGVRLGKDIPKQYLVVGKKPMIAYCLETFASHPLVDSMIVVAEKEWWPLVEEQIATSKGNGFLGFAEPGDSRQGSILSGLKKASEAGLSDRDIVIIHDAARPNVSKELISSCIYGMENVDGVMPVLPIKDTVYQSNDGTGIDQLLNRDELYAGQAPEAFRFGPYYAIHQQLTKQEIDAIRGSSEIAYKNGFRVSFVPGDENNYKITTVADLEKFKKQVEESVGGDSV